MTLRMLLSSERGLPEGLESHELPGIVVGGQPLTELEVTNLLLQIKANNQLVIETFKREANPDSLEILAQVLLDKWLKTDEFVKHVWLLFAAAHLGSADISRRLLKKTAMPNDVFSKREAMQLLALAIQATPEGIRHLCNCWVMTESSALSRAAHDSVQAIARQRGITPTDLSIRSISDRDISGRSLRAGSQEYKVEIDADFSLCVRDQRGKRYPQPPPQEGRSEAENNLNLVDWNELQYNFSRLRDKLFILLEWAMIEELRWSTREFTALFIQRPLYQRCARTLVWGIYNTDGTLQASFCLDEEGSAIDCEYQTVALPTDARIGILHPLHCAEAERRAWLEVLFDFDIVQVFDQMARPVHKLMSHEHDETYLLRLVGEQFIEIRRDHSVIRRNEWQFVKPIDTPGTALGREFPQSGVTAVIEFFYKNPVQYIERAYFRADDRLLRLGEVNPVIVSETIREIVRLTHRD